VALYSPGHKEWKDQSLFFMASSACKQELLRVTDIERALN